MPPSSPDSTYRFEMLMLAVELLEEFSMEIEECTPPETPASIASLRGWTMRFVTFSEYSRDISAAEIQSLCGRLSQPIDRLISYLQHWEHHVSSLDPLLRSYHILPGEEQAVDSVRVILFRSLGLKQQIDGGV